MAEVLPPLTPKAVTPRTRKRKEWSVDAPSSRLAAQVIEQLMPIPDLAPDALRIIKPLPGTKKTKAAGSQLLPTPPPAKKRKPNPKRATEKAPAAQKRAKSKSKTPARSRSTQSARSTVSPSPSAPSTSSRSSRSASVMSGPGFASLTAQPIARTVYSEDCGSFEGAISGADIVWRDFKGYGPYFKGPYDPANPPTVTLEYPAAGAHENFILLFPKDKDDFQPVSEIFESVEFVLKHYLTPAQAASFGYSKCPLPPQMDVDPNEAGPSTAANPLTIWTSIQRGVEERDLSLFLSGIERFNACLLELKTRPTSSDPSVPLLSEIEKNIRAMPGLHQELACHITVEAHHRAVGPGVERLNKHYEPGTSNVYGELLPQLITEIVCRTGLTPSSKLLDLGSGTSHVLLQASLLSGCTSLGVEKMELPAKLAAVQIPQGEIRARMWGVGWGGGVQAVHGDFLEHEDRRKWVSEADVIVCNNERFEPELNDALKALFLDCRDGTKIVSLKPFRSPHFRLMQRTQDDVQAILRVEAWAYNGTESVSWTSRGGVYYIHTVDRSELISKFGI